MKKKLIIASMLICGISSFGFASSWDIKDVLGGGSVGETVGNLVQGVLSTSNIEVKDMAGVWTADGSAVSFKSDNFLKKAGGVAAAAALETKINPYFEQLGLVGAVMTIETDGTFSMKVKGIPLQGEITKSDDGNFVFNFKAFKKVSIGKIPAYVSKSYNHMDVMFDATKLKTLVSSIAKITGISMAKTAASLLDSYDGLCVGFRMEKTGKSDSEIAAEAEGGSSGNGISNLFNNLTGGSKAPSSDGTETKPASSQETSGGKTSAEKATDALKNLLKKK